MSALVSEGRVSAGRTLRLPNGGEYVKRVYVGQFEKPVTPDPLQAEIYSVRQLPGTVVDPHFHAVEQWQVFVEGDGTLGRHSALPGSIHYVDRYTAYGPIVAGPRGLTYFTIRAMTDPGAQFLDRPEARERLKAQGSAKRYLYVDSQRVLPDVATTPRNGVEMDAVIETHADGLAASVARIAPAAEFVTPGSRACGGQALLVLAGELRQGTTALPRLSCAFVDAGDEPLRLSAGASGAVALVMNFPRVPRDAARGG